ncbi:arylsulfatase [Rhodococcus sp. D2-41]|uniref:Arylsulfatase n=1 Tax=Speluncibacter jeojiensis TaxID=2710754 RepID=A0A9X4M3D0_9ACTN|nr:arylsulfatase [Rhodococcus sp. D2-41]MDG3009492.1 arylsulfatase [Rhodococcus sp. D2-41]MDG3016421.1 arylsulfatase [Corynebacteriales bacterium D3-21]
MTKSFNGVIKEDIRDSTPDWSPYIEPSAPENSPNVLYIVMDDTGFGAWDHYGGLIKMPNLKRIADDGAAFTQFHTVAFCSPTRSCLLTGRNATSNGMACIEEITTGFPGSNGRIPMENGTIAEVLLRNGYSTLAVGKWHLTPAEEGSLGARRRTWPLGRGFERYYGFLGGETDQYYPDLVSDNHLIDPPYTPEEGYHLSKDLADKAISFIQDVKATAPNKPWFTYFCPGANHAPHQVPTEWADQYKGVFDMGYEKYREVVLENQKRLGLVPQDTELPPLNPYIDVTGPNGEPWPENDTAREWDTLTDDEKKVFARQAEVYAGFSTYTDAQIGRLLDYLDETGQYENTIIVFVSDNGASGEGGPNGTWNENNFFNSVIDGPEEQLRMAPKLGTVETYNHYAVGWAVAFCTPFKMFKRYAGYEGGTADPMFFSWPAQLKNGGQFRHQYCHAIDVVPTIYDAIGITPPEHMNDVKQEPLHGASLLPALREAGTPNARHTQFYAMLGTRGVWQDGWFANTNHPPMSAGWGHFDQDTWELYHLEIDRNQTKNLAAEMPEKLEELKKLWFQLADEFHGLPLDDRNGVEIFAYLPKYPTPTLMPPTDEQVFYPGQSEVPERTAMPYFGRPFEILAEVELAADSQGVLFAHGGRFGGHSLYIKGGKLHYVYNWLGKLRQEIVSDGPLPTSGKHVLGVKYVIEGKDGVSPTGTATLYIDESAVGSAKIKTQQGHFSLAGEGLNAGRDGGQPVGDYPVPFEFSGGTLSKVTLKRGDDEWVDLEQTLAAGFARD